jgi:hypothetical protein
MLKDGFEQFLSPLQKHQTFRAEGTLMLNEYVVCSNSGIKTQA